MSIPQALAFVQKELAWVEQEMYRLIDTQNALFQEAAHYFLQAAGKKMRPALVLLAGKCCREKMGENIIRAAVALEFIHLASLVHDDVIDHSHRRRGIASVNSRWDNRTAVLLGDYFYSKALGQAAKCGNGVVNAIAELVECLVTGECDQWKDIDNFSVGEEEYYRRIEMKTARFIGICCRLGAMAGKAPVDVQIALAEYGKNLGMAYQIRDDVLDFIGDEQRTGKPKFSDLSNGYITLPVIHALHEGQYRMEMAELLKANKELDQSMWSNITHMLHDGGSITYTMDKMKTYIHLAKACLRTLPGGMGYQSLYSIAEFTEQRMT